MIIFLLMVDLSICVLCLLTPNFYLFLQAATVSSFSKLTVEDLRKLIPLELYPSWVSFTQKQKLSISLSLLMF